MLYSNPPVVFYCNTHYDLDPPIDLNPLVVQAFENKAILVIAARDRQISRVSDSLANNQTTVCGWWNLDEIITTPDDIYQYDIVVILNQDRIHKVYRNRFSQIVSRCKQYIPKTY